MNAFIRKAHRWLSILFTLTVLANIVAVAVLQKQEVWIGLMALFPLILLMISGLWMFVQPYLKRKAA